MKSKPGLLIVLTLLAAACFRPATVKQMSWKDYYCIASRQKAASAPKAADPAPRAAPPQVPQLATRALTLEEIQQMPPATRDMILRAQGRATPALSK